MPRNKLKNLFKTVALFMIMLLVSNGFVVPAPVYAEARMDGMIGEIVLLPYNFEPVGYFLCDGRRLNIADHQMLYSMIGTTYGGNGVDYFNLPKLSAPNDPETASLLPQVRYFICYEGNWGPQELVMSQIVLAPTRISAIDDGRSLSLCNGSMIPINQNQALFALIGTHFGGDGLTNFALPNLLGMSPLEDYEYFIVHSGIFPSYDNYNGNDAYIGAIGLYAYDHSAASTPYARGQLFSITQNAALFSLLGTQFGGDGRTTFSLPDLEMASPLPYLNYHIQLQGLYPPRQ